MRFLRLTALVCLLSLTLQVENAQAYQSRFLTSTLGNVCENTDPKNITGSFILKNVSDQTVEIRVAPLRTDTYEFRFVAEQKVLQPQAETTVHFRGSIMADGKYQVNAKVEIIKADGSVFSTHDVDFYYLVVNERAQASNYEELYLKRDIVDKTIGDSFSVTVDDGKIQRGIEYKQPLPSVDRMIKLDPTSINRIPTDSASPNPCSGSQCPCPTPTPAPTPNPSATPSTNPTPVPSPTPVPRFGACQEEKSLKTMPLSFALNDFGAKPLNGIGASGVFSYKGMDGLLHPAFGWRVRAWKNIPGSGWINVAEDWIQFDGSWNLVVPPLPGQVRFQYIAANRFFTPMNSSEDTYRWVGPIHESIPQTFNEGNWFADTSSGGARGLGEVYAQGMFLWSKLYWEGEINPLRDNTIKVYFPNTTYDCGDGTGKPWSCANTGGQIWLIPAHASRNGVIQHELSHQINYQFWGNDLPPGSGGPHNLGSCYNRGLAMIEGFANFMVFWTQSGRSDDPNAGFDFRPEDPSFACSSPVATNESWVAATFWDLHDKRADGSDNIWFIHPGATPGIYLRQGRLDGLDDFRSIYRAKASSEHRTIVDAIFKQNKITN